MKKATSFLFLGLTAFVFSACGGGGEQQNEKETGVLDQLSQSVDAVQNVSKLAEGTEGLQKRIEELKAMTPISNDELKSVIPEKLDNLKRTSLSIGDMSVFNVVNGKGEYKSEDATKSVTLEITDGAGEGGSAIVSLLMMGLNMNREEITETGFEKIIDFEGTRANVKENTFSDGVKSADIQTIYKERYLITLAGEGYSLDELQKIYKNIQISGLK